MLATWFAQARLALCSPEYLGLEAYRLLGMSSHQLSVERNREYQSLISAEPGPRGDMSVQSRRCDPSAVDETSPRSTTPWTLPPHGPLNPQRKWLFSASHQSRDEPFAHVTIPTNRRRTGGNVGVRFRLNTVPARAERGRCQSSPH
jgi:hypothetical protein